MGQVHKAAPAKAPGSQPRIRAGRHGTARPGGRSRVIAAAADIFVERYDFDYGNDDEDLRDVEAEIARLLDRE